MSWLYSLDVRSAVYFHMLVFAVIGYFCGSFNGAIIVSKYFLADDIRTHGSGNAGLTNFYRTYGGPLTLVVILCDVLKAVIAIRLSLYLVGISFDGNPWTAPVPAGPAGQLLVYQYTRYWAGLWCLLGHMFPCMFQFKGGKGILTGGTIAIMIDWRIALVVWGGFLVLAILTKYVSLGSIWAGASFPFATWFVYRNTLLLALSVLIGGLIVYMHRGNIHRLLTGTENKFSLHKKK